MKKAKIVFDYEICFDEDDYISGKINYLIKTLANSLSPALNFTMKTFLMMNHIYNVFT